MKKIILFIIGLSTLQSVIAHDIDLPESEITIYEQVKNHIRFVELHVEEFEDLFNEIAALRNQSLPIDVQVQELAAERTEFKNDICLPGYNKRQRAFFLYTPDKQKEALEKLEKHYDIVKTHLDNIKNKMLEFETNPSMVGYWQRLRILNKWFEDFRKLECNAVGFGYAIERLLP